MHRCILIVFGVGLAVVLALPTRDFDDLTFEDPCGPFEPGVKYAIISRTGEVLPGYFTVQSAEIPEPTPNIKQLLDRFTVLIDVQKLVKLLDEKIRTDPQAQAVYRYLRGNKIRTIVSHVMNDKEYIKFLRWLYDHGATNVYKEITAVITFFGWDSIPATEIQPDVVVDAKFGKSVQTLMKELMPALPLDAIMSWTLDLYHSQDPAAVALTTRLREPGMAEAWHRLKDLPEVKELTEALMRGGTGIEVMIIIIESFFGWV